jgi:hypothetical protein
MSEIISRDFGHSIMWAISDVHPQSLVWHTDIFIGSGLFRDLEAIMLAEFKNLGK